MYLDFEKYGINNFIFEIIEECKIQDLDNREIYWIEYYDTYKNGYNLTTGGQGTELNLIKKIIDEHSIYKKITSKHWQVYYYLLSQSFYDSQAIENHRYIYKKDFNVSAAAKFLGISRPTIYTAITNLIKIGLLKDTSEAYLIYARNWTKINNETLKSLLGYSKKETKGIDLLRTYLILKKISEVAKFSKDMCFTKRDLVQYLGHNITNADDYNTIRDYIALLSYFNLITLTHHTAYKDGLGSYIIYHIQSINEKIDNIDEFQHTIADMSESAIPEYIKEYIIDI